MPAAKEKESNGFEVVSEDIWKKVENTRPQRSKRSPIVQQLLEENILFIPDGEDTNDKTLNGMYEAMRRHGFKLALRKGEHNGKVGHFAKATKKVESEGATATNG